VIYAIILTKTFSYNDNFFNPLRVKKSLNPNESDFILYVYVFYRSVKSWIVC